jgi:hypothetical protein
MSAVTGLETEPRFALVLTVELPNKPIYSRSCHLPKKKEKVCINTGTKIHAVNPFTKLTYVANACSKYRPENKSHEA